MIKSPIYTSYNERRQKKLDLSRGSFLEGTISVLLLFYISEFLCLYCCMRHWGPPGNYGGLESGSAAVITSCGESRRSGQLVQAKKSLKLTVSQTQLVQAKKSHKLTVLQRQTKVLQTRGLNKIVRQTK